MLMKPDMLSKENVITSLYIESPERVWATSMNFLYALDLANDQVRPTAFPQQGVQCSKMVALNGRLYISTMGSGVMVYDMETGSFEPSLTTGNNIISDLSSHGNSLYIATDGEGVYEYSVDEQRYIRNLSTAVGDQPSLRSNSVYSFMVDDQGLLWVGYYQGGADYTPYVGDYFDIYRLPNGLDTERMTVRSLLIDGDVKLIGTRQGLYYVNEATGMTRHYQTLEISSNLIFSIARWNGLYYIGTYGVGIYELNPRTLQIDRPAFSTPSMEKTSIFSIKVDGNSALWLGTSDGVYRLTDPREIDHITSLNSQLPSGNVYEIFFDSNGRGWFCTENGMAILHDGKIRNDLFPSNFIHHDKIRCIYEDKSNNLYFLPDRGTPVKSDLGLTKWGPVEISSAKSHTAVTFVTQDRQGFLWFGSDQGLVRFDGESHFHLFNKSDGLPNIVFTLCQPQIDEEGSLWMGNSNGLLRLNIDRLRSDSTLHSPFRICDLKANGRLITRQCQTSVEILPSLESF